MDDLNAIEFIVYLYSGAAKAYIVSLFMNIFFNRSEWRGEKYLRGLSYYLYWDIGNCIYLFYQNGPIVTLIVSIIGISVISLTYEGSWEQRIWSVVTIIAVQVMCENIVWFILMKLNIMGSFVIGCVIIQLMTFMVAITLRKMINLENGDEILIGDWLAVIVIPICSVFVVAIMLEEYKNEIAVAISATSMIMVNVLVFFIFNRMQTVYRKQLDVGILEQQNRAYEHQMMILKANEERITSLNHDMRNHLLALDQLAEKEKSDEVRLYLKDLKMSAELDKHRIFTENHVIDGFLNVKLDEASRYGADITVNIAVSQELKINARDISIILGNLLDNALQAIKGIEDKNREKYLTITMREEPGSLYIHISNSHNEKIKRIGKEFQTTKKDKHFHGIGLKNVKRIVDAYGGHMEIEHTQDMFSVELIIFLKSGYVN